MATLADLHRHLSSHIHSCRGEWVAKKSNYESELCEALAITVQKSRHGDAQWEGISIELKKGTSIWLDLVRYAELLTSHTTDLDMNVTLFCIPDKQKFQQRISEVIAVPTGVLLSKLNLTAEHTRLLLDLHRHVPRSLNAQASLTVSDARAIARFVVHV